MSDFKQQLLELLENDQEVREKVIGIIHTALREGDIYLDVSLKEHNEDFGDTWYEAEYEWIR